MNKIEEVIKKIESVDEGIMERTGIRLNNLTKPLGSLGRLEEIAKQVVGITREDNPPMKKKVVFTMAGDHGVVEEGISVYPQEVTLQMVYNFIRGGAGINVLANHVNAKVIVVDMGVKEEVKIDDLGFRDKEKLKINDSGFKDKKINCGTKNFTRGSAMTKEEAIKSIEAGIEVFEEEGGIDIVGIGDMGIGNTTPSSAIVAVYTNQKVEEITGTGTGIDELTLKKKIRVIEQGIEINRPESANAIDVLSKVGGFEIGGLAGVILAGAAAKIPVVIDGFISGAAALIAVGLAPKVKGYLIASHCSVERGHAITLDYLGLAPLFNLNMRLGEGTGAALGINLVEAAIKILTQMATFEQADVSKAV